MGRSHLFLTDKGIGSCSKERAFTIRISAHEAKIPSLRGWARWLISAWVLGLALALIAYRLGDGSLHDWDEAIYAQIAREMLSPTSG